MGRGEVICEQGCYYYYIRKVPITALRPSSRSVDVNDVRTQYPYRRLQFGDSRFRTAVCWDGVGSRSDLSRDSVADSACPFFAQYIGHAR